MPSHCHSEADARVWKETLEEIFSCFESVSTMTTAATLDEEQDEQTLDEDDLVARSSQSAETIAGLTSESCVQLTLQELLAIAQTTTTSSMPVHEHPPSHESAPDDRRIGCVPLPAPQGSNRRDPTDSALWSDGNHNPTTLRDSLMSGRRSPFHQCLRERMLDAMDGPVPCQRYTGSRLIEEFPRKKTLTTDTSAN